MTADQNLAKVQYPDMNRRFFADEHGPSAYLQQRLRALLLGASQDERVKAATQDGLTYETLRLGFRADSDIYEEAAIARFVTLDATVLLHHAAEALTRLYFAVADLPPCPWLEVGRLRAGAYKKRLEALLASLEEDATKPKLLRAFMGFEDYRTLEAYASKQGPEGLTTRALWDESAEAIAVLISHVARVLLDDADAYNAAKHGLAVLAGSATARLGDGQVLDVSGPSLTYLELRDATGEAARPGDKKWSETTAWIEADRSLALVHLVLDRLDLLWRIARARYTQQGSFRMRGLRLQEVEAVLSRPVDEEKGFSIVVQKMHMELLYIVLPDAFGDSKRPGSAKA